MNNRNNLKVLTVSLLSVASVLLLTLLAIYSTENSEDRHLQEKIWGLGIVQDGDPSMRIVGFTLPEKPTISHTTGHSHSPFGIRGDDLYEYDGIISFDGRNVQLHCNTNCPYALFQMGDRYYLLLANYFNWVDFIYMETDGLTPFNAVAATTVPPALCDVRFANTKTLLSYRIWWLSELAKVNDWRNLEITMDSYLDTNPRCMSFLSQDMGTWQEMRFCELIAKIRSSASPRSSMSEVLRRMIEVSTSDDSFNTIANLLWAVLDLDPTNGPAWVCRYKQVVMNSRQKVDNRILAFTDFGTRLKELDCTEGKY